MEEKDRAKVRKWWAKLRSRIKKAQDRQERLQKRKLDKGPDSGVAFNTQRSESLTFDGMALS